MTCFDDIDNGEVLQDVFDGDQAALINLNAYPVNDVLNVLLQDKTTDKNIIWATDSYYLSDHKCKDRDQIKIDVFRTGIPVVLKPRSQKDSVDQLKRTRKKAEVFTPEWICNKMNNHCDEEWFGHNDIFNHMNEDNTWTVTESKIAFSFDGEWKNYVDSRRLEITCGEAPFIVSRYDAATGELIYPLYRRTGILDRKLRIVNENTDNIEDWTKWVIRAFQGCYGYEWQGDNLLIARINLLMTFYDYYKDRWESDPEPSLLKQIASIITWNFWQMNGLEDTVPFGRPYQKQRQMTLMDSFDKRMEGCHEDTALPCKIRDWRHNKLLQFMNIKKVGNMSKKLFDFVIGNPPYQDSVSVNNRDSAVYNYFYEAAEMIADRYILITPARFLFNTGLTPKDWNLKMLSDVHIKVIKYIQNSSEIFPNTEIKGGVVILYRDRTKEFGAINDFIPNEELRQISSHFVKNDKKNIPIIMYGGRSDLKFNDKFIKDHPESIDLRIKAIQLKHPKVTTLNPNEEFEIKSSTLEILSEFFIDEEPKDVVDYYKILGLVNGKRIYKWIEKKYVTPRYPKHNNLGFYKVIVPESNGSGEFGEILSSPIVIGPNVTSTPTFISIGCFETRLEAENALKYIKTKLVRALLGILKKTQHNATTSWSYVPLQDFTDCSDINWSRSVKEIDEQLYKKYNLSAEEMEFIETHVQEMK